jgi:hypothetical protein
LASSVLPDEKGVFSTKYPGRIRAWHESDNRESRGGDVDVDFRGSIVCIFVLICIYDREYRPILEESECLSMIGINKS